MCARYMPKTLAKTLTYILHVAPWEYGLFWDPDGTMPWKEAYWAFQEDPELRFVRESHFREISFLGIDMPVKLEGNLLRILPGSTVPDYPVCADPPERLYHACRRKHYPFLLQHGLTARARPCVPLAAEKDMALRLGRRRDPEPILIEVFGRRAKEEGVTFYVAGPGLYLARQISAHQLLFPPLRLDEQPTKPASRKVKEGGAQRAAVPHSPGSFTVAPEHIHEIFPENKPAEKNKRGKRDAEWKKNSRKDRRKREV